MLAGKMAGEVAFASHVPSGHTEPDPEEPAAPSRAVVAIASALAATLVTSALFIAARKRR